MAYSNETGLPSVTDVISTWVETRWFTPESCERGNQAHDRIAAHLTYDFMPNFNNDYIAYFNSFLKFESRIKEVVLVEKRIANHELGYCGQPDLVFVDQDGVLTLLDWKTAVSVAKYYQLQLGGYSILLKTIENLDIKKLMLVRLRKEEAKLPLISVYNVSDSERLFTNQLELFKMLGDNSWKKELKK